MRVQVRTVSNEQHEVHFDEATASVLDVKTSIAQITAIHPERQRLIYKGKVLLDEIAISNYNIDDNGVIHMVARPENFRELQRQANESTSSSSNTNANANAAAPPQVRWTSRTFEPPNVIGHGPIFVSRSSSTTAAAAGAPSGPAPALATSSGVPSRAFEPLNVIGHGPFLVSRSSSSTAAPAGVPSGLAPALATSSGVPVSGATSAGSTADNTAPTPAVDMEHLRQNLLTVDTLLSTMDSPFVTSSLASSGFRRFHTGQWLDVKDTVNQWLEATILQIDDAERKIFVHYNGWPSRWDEWISTDSDRIAPFRSRTAHSSLNVTQSPQINIAIDNAPLTGVNDVRTLIPELARAISVFNDMMEDVSDACELSLSQTPLQESAAMATDLPWNRLVQGSLQSNSDLLRRGVPDAADESDRVSAEQQLIELYREVCPLMDRLGRAMCDMSSLMWNTVEPGSLHESASNRSVDPGGTLESRLLSFIRRPASPPPARAYRAPISAATRRMNGSDVMRNPSSLLSLIASGAMGTVHVALAPAPAASAPHTNALTSSAHHGSTGYSTSSFARTAAETSSLRSQMQALAQRTQELTDRANAVTQLSATLWSSIHASQDAISTPQSAVQQSSVEPQPDASSLPVVDPVDRDVESADFSFCDNDDSESESIPIVHVANLSDSAPNQDAIDELHVNDGSEEESEDAGDIADLTISSSLMATGTQTLIPGDSSDSSQRPFFVVHNTTLNETVTSPTITGTDEKDDCETTEDPNELSESASSCDDHRRSSSSDRKRQRNNSS